MGKTHSRAGQNPIHWKCACKV